MKLYKVSYKNKKFGKLYTVGQKAVMNACVLNLTWEETE